MMGMEPLSKSDVAVIVPVYRSGLTADEQVSLRHLTHFLHEYDRYWLAPESLKVPRSGFGVRRFSDHWFGSVATYSRLLLSREFYEAFADYEYILIYQLDCLVFSDRLTEWCEMGYDYVGAPWFKSKTDPASGFSRVGNGGFSLRRVDGFLKVIDSQRYMDEPVPYWHDVLLTPVADLQEYPLLPRLAKRLKVFRDVRRGCKWYRAHYTLNEDHFWSDRAKLFYPAFRIAPVRVGLGFSFEGFPDYCSERNDHQLPFGCHAWARWDREFWEPYLLENGGRESQGRVGSASRPCSRERRICA
jgi:hypothetical protein